MENDELENQEIDEEEMEQEEMEEKWYETMKYLLTTIQAILCVLNELISNISHKQIQRSLTRRPITSKGYDYINKILQEDPIHFRQLYRMYPDVFLKLCNIIREKTPVQDTRFICIEEMVASFLHVVGQNSRYCVVRDTFGRSHYNVSRNFNKILGALNRIAVDMMAKPSSSVPEKIRESTRFYPYFKVSMCYFYF